MAERQDHEVEEADHVYLLMKEDYRISRNVRLAWFLSRLNQVVCPASRPQVLTSENELDLLSVLPKGWQAELPSCPDPAPPPPLHLAPPPCRLTPSTRATFLARRYRFIIELDLSPSTGIVDDSTGEMIFDEVFHALSRCLSGLAQPFQVPGTDQLFKPKIFITILAYSSIIGLASHQVLVQGCQLDRTDLDEFLLHIYQQLKALESNIADVLHQQREHAAADEPPHRRQGVSMVPADMGLVSMVRQGILALQLLPPNSSAGVIIITDGVTSVPDVAVCEALLNQLRSGTIACSFVQVGGAYSYDCSFGYIPNVELMKFISLATFGSYLASCPAVAPDSRDMNAYHRAFLTYSFLKTPESLNAEYFCVPQHRLFNEHLVSASGNPALVMRRKKHTEKEVHAHLVSVVSVRLREGYTIREISLAKGGTQLEVKLVLLWKHNMHIEYLAAAPWPLDAGKRSTRVEVTMEGSYDILHDISCTQRKPITSPYRTSVIRRFWNTLQSINQTDQMLVHLQSFNSAPENYTLPESTKNGVPLFYIPPGSTTPVPSLQHSGSQSQFSSYWKPILSMDATFWQRWLHMHRLALILEHDTPVPKHLHTAGNNGRYGTIQCRIAHSALTSLLRDCSSFVLVEGYAYVTLICSSSDQPPSSFYLVRLISKTPCMVLRLGFPIGTPAHVRNKIVDGLREQILQLRFPHRVQSKEATPKTKRRAGAQPSPSRCPSAPPLKTPLSDRPCVVVLNKPLEKLLIRYEKLPVDFRTPSLFSTDNCPAPSGRAASSTLVSLSRYFLHRRWVWAAPSGPGPAAAHVHAAAHVLAMLSEIRLSEGFHFASSAEGIINMVMELPMKANASTRSAPPPFPDRELHLCTVQYVLFPPQAASTKDSFSTDEDDGGEADAADELSLVTECWVEPQSGTATDRHCHLEGLEYHQIPDAIFPRDLVCMSTLMTFEYLSQICHFKDHSCAPPTRVKMTSDSAHPDDSIHMVPFQFNLMQLLPRCQQAELLFATFSPPSDGGESPSAEPNELLLELFHGSVERELSDRRVPLADGEHAALARHILERERDGRAPPFGDDAVMSFHTAGSSKEVMGSTSTLQSCSDGVRVDEETSCFTPQWRCYVRAVGPQQLLLTFLPSTFADVAALVESRLEVDSEPRPIGRSPLTCPVYVYSCLLEQLKEQLVQPASTRRPRDFFFRSPPLERGGPPPWSDAHKQKEPANHCSLLTEHFHHSYVKGLYRSLQQGLAVAPQDVLVAVDYCEESLQEVDVSAFLRALCGHARHGSGGGERRPAASEPDVPDVPLTRCEAYPNLHGVIQDKFSSILSRFFRSVPSSPHFFFYCPPSSKKDSEDGEAYRRPSEEPLSEAEPATEDESPSGGGALTESDTDLVVEYEDLSRSPSESDTVHRDQDSFSIPDGEAESLLEAEPPPDLPPMFLHLTCSVSTKSRHGSAPVRTLPTCLGELISRLENAAAFGLADPAELSVTLDVYVLTLPPEIEAASDFHHDRYPSESSASLNRSPGLEEGGADSVSADPFSRLPLPHKLAVLATTDEIRWLLEDEMVSALRRPPAAVEPAALRTVAEHILRSAGRPHCRCEDVPLQFVFGSEQSLEKFKEEFRRLAFPGYALNGVEEGFYYMSRHRTHKHAASDPPGFPEAPDAAVLHAEPRSPPEAPSGAGLDGAAPSACHGPSRLQSVVSSQGSVDSDMQGYDGGSSDSDRGSPAPDEPDWRSPPMPDFWLMVEILQDRVKVYSHSRSSAPQEAEPHAEHLQLHHAVVRRVGDICRTVNQILLLQDLHDSHICNTLLVAESEEDLWKDVSLYRQRLNVSDDYSTEESYPARDYLAATMQFMPGHFSCDVVWRTVIPVHPRLKMGPNVSRAMQALRSVLNSFCVVNRKNMFVYQERSTKSVFYLRLCETSLPEASPDADAAPPPGTRSGLARSQEPWSPEEPADGSRPPQDGSRSVGQVDKHILLLVHGVGSAGPEITDELLKVLRKRLDETTLDIITVMLVRNCKLTPADVEFIQPSGSPSTEVMTFSLPLWLRPRLPAAAHYLRQNLLIFLHLPKYTDNNTAHHFKHYLHLSGDAADGKIYLYNKPGGQGTGGKGIACITLSFVDAHGRPLQDDDPAQRPERGAAPLHPDHFQELTAVAPAAADLADGGELLVRFDVWEQGNISPSQLSEKLQAALRHALADLVMELRVLPRPLCTSAGQIEVKGHGSLEDRDGKEGIQQRSGSRIIQPPGAGLFVGGGANPESTTPTGKSTRRSFWDILSKPESAELGSPKTTDDIVQERGEEGRVARRRHKTENVKQQWSQERTAEPEQNPRRASRTLLDQGDIGTLHPVYQDTCESWITFMVELGCPSIQHCSAQVSAHFLVPSILSEIMSLVSSLASDTTVKAFSGSPSADVFIPFYLDQNLVLPPLSSRSFILIGRNFQQWSCSSEPDDGPDENAAALHHFIPHKGLQRFEALEHGDGSGPGPGLGPGLGPGPTPTGESFGPRQRFLFISVCNKKVALYSYNWSVDLGVSLNRELVRLVKWQNARAHVLHCLFHQKMGLFHHYCFSDVPAHHIHSKQDPNPFLGPSMEPDALLRSAVPPLPSKDPGRLAAGGRSLAPLHFPSELLPFDEALRDACALRGLPEGDVVARHGGQLLEIKAAERRELEKQMKIENLFVTWQQRSAQSNMPISAADLETLKQSSRLVHYCATPLLFDPAFRQQIQEEQAPGKKRHRSNDSAASGRDRSHSGDSGDVPPGRPKEEPWLLEICSTFLQQYVQYLQSLGFILVQVRPQSPARSIARARAALLSSTEGRMSFSYVKQKSEESSPKMTVSGTTAYHLQRALPGGIVLIELAFQGSYFCVKQYALECSRIPMGQTVNSQGGLLAKPRCKPFPDGAPVSDCALSMIFTEECDRVRDLMLLHPFSHDFHLRVAQQQLLGLQPLRPGYQLHLFLDHFLERLPDGGGGARGGAGAGARFSRNHVCQGAFSASTGSTSAHQLYGYVTDHAGSYGLKPLRMSRTPAGADGKNEYALVSLWTSSGSYRDPEGLQNHDDFDVSLVAFHDAAPFEEQSDGERNLLRLRFYVVMTSQRELFPHLTADTRRFRKLPVHREENPENPDPPPESRARVPPPPTFPLLQNEVAAARRLIQSAVEQALGHCRRDNLWRRLFHGEHALERLKLHRLTFCELEELLENVQSCSVGDIDPQLEGFLTMNPAWYQSLIKVLLNRFPQSCRHFDEGGVQYLAVLNQKFTDCFVLVFLDCPAGNTSLKVVFREPLPPRPVSGGNPPPQLVSMFHHLESVINAACFNLWTGLL